LVTFCGSANYLKFRKSPVAAGGARAGFSRGIGARGQNGAPERR
jgi:hypothetical protein